MLWGSETSLSDLVVDLLVEVLDEDVALTSLAQRGVTLRPHDTASIAYKHRMDSAMTAPQNLPGTAFDQRVVELLEGALACIGGELTWNGRITVGERTRTISSVEVVDVGVAERATGDSITADADAERGMQEVRRSMS